MSVSLQIAPRLCCKRNYWPYNTNTEGLREIINKLCSIELSQSIFRLVVAIFFSQKSSNCAKRSHLTHLMSMVFFHTLWKLWGIKKTSVIECVKKHFLCVDNFWSVSFECQKSYLILQKISKIKIQKGSKIKTQKGSTIKIQNSSNFT